MEKRFFSTKQFVILMLFIIALIGIWGVFAFLIDEGAMSRVSLWATLVFGTGTIITSVLAIGISLLSKKNEARLRRQKLEEDANRFIYENNEEIVYIPLCLIANAFDNHHKFVRKIYNAFNVLNKELQKEILRQLNYDVELITGNLWIEKGLDLVRNFVSENDLGSDFLYDGGKYFHRAIKYSDLPYDPRCEYEHIMPDAFNWNPKIFFTDDKAYTENVSFFTYLDSYLTAKKNDVVSFSLNKDKKPLLIIAAIENLRNCPEENVCYWVMEIVDSIATLIIRDSKVFDGVVRQLTIGDAQIETFEDRYLDVLMVLYNLHLVMKESQTRIKR